MDLIEPNSMIELISPLLRIWEVQGSSMGPNTCYIEFFSVTPNKLYNGTFIYQDTLPSVSLPN
jgi:hypothetical protein